MSDEDIPPLKYVDYKKVDFEKGEAEIDWSNEEVAVEFMLNLVGHKVTGVEKHILMNHIHQNFIKKTGIDVGTTQLWSKLNTMYDLEQLESHQNLPPWDDSQVDFQLPKELLPTPPPPPTPSSGKKEFLPPSKRVKEEVIETPHKNNDANSKKRATNPHKTPSSTRSKDHSSRSSSSKKDHKKDHHSNKKDHHSSKKDSSRKRHLRTPNTGSTKKKSRK